MAKTLNINGKSLSVEASPDTPLLWVLRDELGMTGTKYGCGVAQCGACTVNVNGAAMRSCQTPIGALEGAKITTIEGLGGSHPLQVAWVKADVPQCGNHAGLYANGYRNQLRAHPIAPRGQRAAIAAAAWNPLTHVAWHKVAPRLAERFHVVAADLRGRSGSNRAMNWPGCG